MSDQTPAGGSSYKPFVPESMSMKELTLRAVIPGLLMCLVLGAGNVDALGRRLPRITVPGFDYSAAPAERLEIPIAERIAAIRARKASDRERAKAKGERRSAAAATGTGAPRRGGPVASTGTIGADVSGRPARSSISASMSSSEID